jgi:hypothetical protein
MKVASSQKILQITLSMESFSKLMYCQFVQNMLF